MTRVTSPHAGSRPSGSPADEESHRHAYDGVVSTDTPNGSWGTDATMAWTRNDGWATAIDGT